MFKIKKIFSVFFKIIKKNVYFCKLNSVEQFLSKINRIKLILWHLKDK